jgi:hypothetical protein
MEEELKISIVTSRENPVDYENKLIRDGVHRLIDFLSIEKLRTIFTIKDELHPLLRYILISVNKNN